MRKVSLTTQITIGMLVGAIAGMLFGKNVSAVTVVGDIFLRLIQMAVVLLIFGAVIEALGSLNPRDLGRLGAKTGLWFLMTTLLAALVGLGTGLLFKPGLSVHLDQLHKTAVHLNTPTNISQTILNFFPTNIFDALAKGNVIQVIIFAILFGLVLSQANKDGKFSQVLTLVKQTNQLTVKLVMLIMKAAPLGIAALMVGVVADNGSQVFLPLLTFLLIYGLATAVFLIALFCVISWVAKVPLVGLVHGFTQIIMVAFTTTSSAVALPVEMSDAQSKLGVSKPISQLVLPPWHGTQQQRACDVFVLGVRHANATLRHPRHTDRTGSNRAAIRTFLPWHRCGPGWRTGGADDHRANVRIAYVKHRPVCRHRLVLRHVSDRR